MSGRRATRRLGLAWGGPDSTPAMNLARLMQKGRAFGVRLVLATQNPQAKVLSTLARENAGVRVAFKVDDYQQSKAILGGTKGAEKRPPITGERARPGRCLLRGLANDVVVLQSYAIDDETIAAVSIEQRRRDGAALGDGTPDSLTAEERMLLEHCLAERGGKYPRSELVSARACGLSERQIHAITQSLKARRLISRASVTEPYALTERAFALLGAAPGMLGRS